MNADTITPGDVSLLARELDAVLRAAEHVEEDQTLLLNAATRLSARLVAFTDFLEGRELSRIKREEAQ